MASRKILIADDTSDLRLLLRALFEDDDRFEVVGEACNGAEAVEQVESKKPDAILLDLAMPVMDGLQAIPRIRESSPRTKIVVLTGFDSDSLSSKALGLGAHAYLEKGVAFEEITGTLLKICD
jgi:DNA-binding NarL/FixJ family response regulator